MSDCCKGFERSDGAMMHSDTCSVFGAARRLPQASAPEAGLGEVGKPIDMILHCPKCHVQHIDEAGGEWDGKAWDNPPHKSHLCLACGHIWRPADVPTNGVAATKTKGKADSASSPVAGPVGWKPNSRVGLICSINQSIIRRANALDAVPHSPIIRGTAMISCTSTHCERRQECCAPHDCTGSAKRQQTPCEHCGEVDQQGIRDEFGLAVIICRGCKAFVGIFDDDEGSRP